MPATFSRVFIGRSREVAELDAAIVDARAGRGRFCLLTGFAYIETPTTNPARHAGLERIERLAHHRLDRRIGVRFRVIDAAMVPEPTFSAQTPATGTFMLDAVAAATRVMRP